MLKTRDTERYDLDVLSEAAQLADIEAEWRALEEHASPFQLFQCFDWVESWWRHVGSAGPHTLHVLAARRDGRLVGLWPGVVTRKGPLRILASAGGLLTCYDDALVDAAHPEVVSELYAAMRSARVDLLMLPAVHECSVFAKLDLGQSTAQTTAPFVDCRFAGGFDAYLGSRPKKMRKNQRRSWRMLEKEGAIECRVHDRELSPREAVARALELKKAWVEARGLPAKTLMSNEGQRFLVDVCERFAAEGSRVELCLGTLRLDGEPISIGIGMRLGSRHYEYVGAFDPRYDAHGCGRARMEHTIRDCFDRGLAAYDMLTPSTVFKTIWTDEAPIVREYLLARSFRGRCYRDLYLARVRPGLKRAFNAMPRGLRRWMGRAAFGR